MKKIQATQTEPVVSSVENEPTVHPLQKSYMFISSRHVEYNNLTALEAVSMTAVLALAVMVGVTSTMLG